METVRPYSQILKMLQEVGLRPTRQRLALAKILFAGAHRHITAESLHTEARSANVHVSLATVYNTLHQFTNTGLLREIVVDATRSYFDTNTEEHHHFFFEKSGRLHDVPAGRISVEDIPEPPPGTTIQRIDVVIRVKDQSA